MNELPIPPKEAIIFEDDKLYVCLASYPQTKGHTIIVWKGHVEDLHSLTCKAFQHLLNMVDVARDTLLEVLDVEKVYLVYMDEINDVHWHLIPRYEKKGFDVFLPNPAEAVDFSLGEKIKPVFQKVKARHHGDFE